VPEKKQRFGMDDKQQQTAVTGGKLLTDGEAALPCGVSPVIASKGGGAATSRSNGQVEL
jgi:hypothetical protein